MDLRLKDKHVLITGGGRGIGLACVERFLEEGCRVTVAVKTHETADAVKAKHDVGVCVIDLARPGAGVSMTDSIEKQYGDIDVLVNSAGSALKVAPDAVGDENWRQAMDNKFFTYMHTLDGVLPKMMKRGRGSVVNIVGFGGRQAVSSHLPGGSANAALMLASAGLANHYAKHGIRINTVNPVAVMTDRLQQSLEVEAEMAGITVEEARQRVISKYPMGRIMRPDEVADVVVFLSSDRASYVSGVSLTIDGAATPMIP